MAKLQSEATLATRLFSKQNEWVCSTNLVMPKIMKKFKLTRASLIYILNVCGFNKVE
jgi:hypothetical protein